ncbi:FAD-dependent oxidoreductase [Mycolicibacterium sediminis]|uniref:Hydroxylase n=1 Tax=Mycolicibacterium sediminis TaxID=1286180 RepID=A0A7I7QUH6_9MYCO|nr:2-polyprenyl-6-methoxyphenol hydroxylase-like oxidoreductase [Mycolicibacterium sediminis]BBY30028.1 hydroxylase [Mycolicibacterium sediminis]
MRTEHAIVHGASFAGLLAARVLSDVYGSVTVVERDTLPSGTFQRRGVSQGHHLHQMLSAGVRRLDDLFPGIIDELESVGAVVTRGTGDPSEFHLGVGDVVFCQSGRFTRSDDMVICLASRPLLEAVVRARVRGIAHVRVLDGHDVVEPVMGPQGRVIGTRVVARATGDERLLEGDLVVDTTGRAASIPAFLESQGFDRPGETRYDVNLSYSSQLFGIRPGDLDEKVVLAVPTLRRPEGIGIMAYEDDTVIVTLIGLAGRTTPTESTAFLEAVERFVPAHVMAALRSGEARGEMRTQRYPVSIWRRYDRLGRFPDGLLVMGDALCSFNPVYGQGMTSAALQAVALRSCLRDGPEGLSRRFFRAAATKLSPIWWSNRFLDWAIIPSAAGPTSLQKAVNVGMDRIYAAAGSDVGVAETVYRQMQLLGRPTDVLRPSILTRVVSGNRRARTPG